MLPATFQALAAIFLAVLPGAVLVYTVERIRGAWGAKATDRLLRFVVASAVLHLAAAPVTYMLWRDWIHSKKLAAAPPFPWPLWWVAVGYVVIPAVLGTLIGMGIPDRHNRWTRRRLRGRGGPPRAWDYCFAGRPNGYVRILLDIGADEPSWLAGSFTTEGKLPGQQAFVAAYPEDPDIYLPVQVGCDPETGELETDEAGNAVPVHEAGSLLARHDRIIYLEFIV